MARLTIYKDDYADSTLISNRFIDEYMKDANDAQLKVYFYLIRMLNAHQAISVSGIADKFNHTEKDVLRSLKYWEKNGILDLDYNNEGNLIGVHLRDLSTPAPMATFTPAVGMAPVATSASATYAAPAKDISMHQNALHQDALHSNILQQPRESARLVQPAAQLQTTAAAESAAPTFTKPSYSLDQLREFKSREETAQLLFIAESYIGKPLTPSEIKTILFFIDVLHFSEEMIDHLLQYCVDRGKKDFKYIEKVAINWAEEGITTPEQAQNNSGKYDKNVYTIMNELGKNGAPTTKEMEFINRWTKEYGFSTDIILEACERTVLATDKHRFEYAEGILSSWKRENVHHKTDIHRIDEIYKKKKKPSGGGTTNKFNQFTQNSYDFDALERELLSN